MTDTAAPRGPARPDPLALLGRHPLRAIVSLAAPTTAVMLMAAISNVLHTYFVSRLGDDAIAAVSLVFPIALILMTVVSGGFGTGVASGIARALGAGRTADARLLAEQAMGITFLLSIAVTIATELGGEALFAAMGGRGPVLEQAVQFARVLFGGLLVTLTIGTMDSVLRGTGNVRIPALCSSLSLALQIAFTPLLMFTLNLGLIGAPLATIAGQLIGLVPRAAYVYGGRAHFHPAVLPRRFHAAPVKEILRVGVPASLSAGLNYVALVILTGVVARHGNAYLAGYGLGTRLDFVLFTLGFGVAAAGLTLVGLATGAGRPELVRRYVWQASLVAMAIVAVPAALVTAWPTLWIGLFTSAADIQDVGARYFLWVGPSYPLIVASMVIATAFQGVGRATVPLTVMAVRVALVIAATLLIASGPDQIFAIIAAGNVLGCVALALLFRAALR